MAEAVQGATDLYAKLAALEKKVARKLERQGTRKGTKVFADEIKKRVPKDTGLLRGAITVRALKRKKGRVGHRVTINTQRKGGGKRAKAKVADGGFFTTSKSGKKHFYPAIIEYGAKGRPAKAPMRKSFDAKQSEAVIEVVVSIREGIREAIKSQTKKELSDLGLTDSEQ